MSDLRSSGMVGPPQAAGESRTTGRRQIERFAVLLFRSLKKVLGAFRRPVPTEKLLFCSEPGFGHQFEILMGALLFKTRSSHPVLRSVVSNDESRLLFQALFGALSGEASPGCDSESDRASPAPLSSGRGRRRLPQELHRVVEPLEPALVLAEFPAVIDGAAPHDLRRVLYV